MNSLPEVPTSMRLRTLVGWRKGALLPHTLTDCAVIVPTYRRIGELLRLLNVMADIPAVPAELIIVDGSPGEEVNLAVQKWSKARSLSFDLLYIKSPAGLTRQRNVGLDACRKDFIFFLDDDSVPASCYFTAIRKVFADDVTGEVGAVRGFLTNHIDRPVPRLWRLRYALRIVPRGRPGLYHHCGTSGTWNGVPAFSGTKSIDILIGCASTYRREVFLKHRFSSFFEGYSQGEDFEMSLRLCKDWRILLCGDAHIDHREAPHGRPPGFVRGRMVARNRYFIWKRHSRQPGVLNRFRFWGDQLLTTVYHMGCFCVRPWRPYYIAYAIGTVAGLCQCLICCPQHTEPPVQKEYTFRFDELNRILDSQGVA